MRDGRNSPDCVRAGAPSPARPAVTRSWLAAAVAAVVGLSAAAASAQPGGALASDRPARVRLTPTEYLALPGIEDRANANAAGAERMESRILKGDPSRLGLYTILLKVPPHTRIAAHTHPDERIGTVIAGTWYYGYGERFDENALKALPPGSYYTEPADTAHFARSGDETVLVQITGVGPTGTTYVDPANSRQDR